MKNHIKFAVVAAILLSTTPASARARSLADVDYCVWYSKNIMKCLFG